MGMNLDDVAILKKLVEYESTNFQWQKLALNWGMVLVLILISILRGSGEGLSMIDVARCDKTDWFLFGALQICCLLFLGYGIYVVKTEHALKVKVRYEFTPGDLQATNPKIARMVIVSFFGSAAAAFCGVGPGFIFAPLLVVIGIEPQVATATGMYVTMFTTLAATIQTMVFKKINL
jgi:hypothetical protein